MEGTEAPRVSCGLALSWKEQFQRGRKFGKFDFDRFQSLSTDYFLGEGNIGEVEVACKFLLSESRWGVLTPQKNPGGVLYLDLTFTEPSGCRLKDATVVLTLNEEDESLKQTFVRQGTPRIPVHITHYGPDKLYGPISEAHKVVNHSFSPSVDIGGIAGAGGIGRDSQKQYKYQSRWKFFGHTMPNKLATVKWHPTIMRWSLIENELERQPHHDNTFHTGFAFEHDGQPFLMRVEIYGNLEGKASDLRHKTKKRLRKFKFPVEAQSATTLVNFGGRYNAYLRYTTILDEFARNLPRDMAEKNMKPYPQLSGQPNKEDSYELIEEEDPEVGQDIDADGQLITAEIIDQEIKDIRRELLALMPSGQGLMAIKKPAQTLDAPSPLNGPDLNDIILPIHSSQGSSSTTSATAMDGERQKVNGNIAVVRPHTNHEKLQQLLGEIALPTVIQVFIWWIVMKFSAKVKVSPPSKMVISPPERPS
ncbi:hypothetical protein F4821DRAFT_201506 [Hypoxylon rubiginosum]|uniref:Uncharacterized protein n=1 Tax=Hypoxylon rubiginosum TaxID=110542 RepID=A0ACC0DGE6_9PEZI|nr:hypothetical protein F4821DRAFT_201506 [Hypoxylon rubiginosum]